MRKSENGYQQKRWSPLRFLIVLLLGTAGLGLMTFPQAADWYTSFARSDELKQTVRITKTLPPEEANAILEAAKDYNSKITRNQVSLQDPYNENGDEEISRYDRYMEQLKTPGTDVIARVYYEGLNIDLPVYHTSDMDILSKGAGHLYGTALPVGGEGTHSVLVGHSGYTFGRYFSSLHDAKVGDFFLVEVLGETLYYKVRDVKVVEPENTDAIRIEPGKDLLTLLTCTPIGVNSQRLLVTGERVDKATAEAAKVKTIPSPRSYGIFDPVQWWIFIILGGNLLLLWLSGWGFVRVGNRRDSTED